MIPPYADDSHHIKILRSIHSGNIEKFSKQIKKANYAASVMVVKYLLLCADHGRTSFFRPLLRACRSYRNPSFIYLRLINLESVSSETKIELFKVINFFWSKLAKVTAVNFFFSARARKDGPLLNYFLENQLEFEYPYSGKGTSLGKHRSAPLLHFASCFRPDLIEDVLALGVYINSEGRFRHTALIDAIIYGQLKSVKILSEHNSEIVLLKHGITPLMVAAIYGEMEVANFLISKGFNINATDKFGRTAFIWAAMYGKMSILEFFLEMGAVTDSLRHGAGPLCWTIVAASYASATTKSKYYTSKMGFGPEFKPTFDLEGGACTVLKYLITICNDKRDLHLAVCAAIKMKIRKGLDILVSHKNFDINYTIMRRDSFFCTDGETVLLHAISNSIEFVQIAIDLGADVNLKAPERGRAPLEYAIRIGNYQVAFLLLENGGKLELEPKARKHFMKALLAAKHFGAVLALIKSNMNLDLIPSGNGSIFDFIAKYRYN